MNRKTNETEMLVRFRPGAVLLPPLLVTTSETQAGKTGGRADAWIEVALPGEEGSFRFVVEAKSRSTPEAVWTAVAQAKAAVRDGEWPMIQVPYLSPERLGELERAKVSGVDLCGNGVVIVPGRLWVLRSGQPNQYPDSRPLNNPYRGRSAMVARILVAEPVWPSLDKLLARIREAGIDLSLGQASKAVRAMEEDLIVAKAGRTIRLQEPVRLLDRLGAEWGKLDIRARQAFRVRLQPAEWAARLSADRGLRWAVTGESSAPRYVMFSQGGPRRVAVSSMTLAASLLGGTPEPVPSFADVELLETEEPGFYFANETDDNGVRWASRLQTWLELQGGDARQQEAAQDLRRQILPEGRP